MKKIVKQKIFYKPVSYLILTSIFCSAENPEKWIDRRRENTPGFVY